MRFAPFDPEAFAPRPRVLMVTATPTLVGEARTGEWCSTCLLPSRVDQDVELRTSAGGVIGPGLVVQVCEGCGEATLDRRST